MKVLPYIKATVENLVFEVPFSLLESGLSAVVAGVGVAGTTLSMATAGKIQFFNRMAERATPASKNLVAAPFSAVLKVLNPNYKLSERVVENGVATKAISEKIFVASEILTVQPNPVVRELGSRVGYLLGAAVSVATRVADFAIGVFAGAAACATFARFKNLNDFALNHLESTRVVADVSKGLRGFINPHQFAALRTNRLPDFD